MSETIVASAPGRICLFGEHQDYLGLPVVAMAIDLRFYVEFRPNNNSYITIHTPDLKHRQSTRLELYADKPRFRADYCWGIASVLREQGFAFPRGGDATFHSDIPYRAGCSSSSAMSAAWMRLLLEIGEHPEKNAFINNAERVANLVYVGEKVKFAGAGGMMDQYSCYLGGLVHVFPEGDEETSYGVERLAAVPDNIILVDSGQPKDTQGVLGSVSERARSAVQAVESAWPGFDLRSTLLEDFDRKELGVSGDQLQIVRDHLINRDLTVLGLGMLRGRVDESEFGSALNEEHRILSQTLGISTPRIEELRQDCLDAGALGGKINGSGGGGTFFVYAPGKTSEVSQALADRGVRHHPVGVAEGARIDG